nr:hypothetical protein [Lichenicola cladoniae]
MSVVPARSPDRRIVDLAGARFAASRHVGNLDFADIGERPAQQRDQVPFSDLCMVQVEHQSHLGPVHAAYQRQAILGRSERHAGMVHCGIEVFQHEHDVMPGCQVGQPMQGRLRRHPHPARYGVARGNRQALSVQAGAMQVQARYSKRLGDRDRQLGCPQQFVRAVPIRKAPGDITGHRREACATGGQGGNVVPRPVPDLDLEAERVDPSDAFDDRERPKYHLGADSKVEVGLRHGHRFPDFR